MKQYVLNYGLKQLSEQYATFKISYLLKGNKDQISIHYLNLQNTNSNRHEYNNSFVMTRLR